MPLWLKAAPPTALAAGGVALALLAPGSAPDPRPTAWVDSPTLAQVLTAGPVTVIGHATSTGRLTELDLLVDGTQVAVDDHPEVASTLIRGTFTWQATPGSHVLTVRSGSIRSADQRVLVAGPAGSVPTPATSSAPLPASSSAGTASSTAAPTAVVTTVPPTAPPSPSATPSPTRSPSPTRTPSPTPKPTHSPTPPPAPVVSSVSVSPSYIATGSCTGTSATRAMITVRASNATSVTVTFDANGHGTTTVTLTRSGGTFTGAISAASLAAADDKGSQDFESGSCLGRNWTVTATAHGNGSSSQGSALAVGYTYYKP